MIGGIYLGQYWYNERFVNENPKGLIVGIAPIQFRAIQPKRLKPEIVQPKIRRLLFGK